MNLSSEKPLLLTGCHHVTFVAAAYKIATKAIRKCFVPSEKLNCLLVGKHNTADTFWLYFQTIMGLHV